MNRMFFAILLCAVTLGAQQPAPPPSNPAAPQPEAAAVAGHYVGVASCISSGCHGATQPLQAQRIRKNEYYTWLHSDRHAGAYNILFNTDSARIVKNMRLGKKPYKEQLCLDCHSTSVAPAMVSGRIDVEDGVQCEACHGPASGWQGEHMKPTWTHEQSVANGMRDLRNTHVRGQLCDTCHVGAASKEVDHDLIASGHPILQFELDNYTETMPPHWNRNNTHGVPAWAAGQVTAFRDSLDNLARHARGEKWPEFSDMSCFNCHHALKTSTWRQERGWPGRPGLPAWSPQRWDVLRLIVARVSPDTRAQLDDAVQQLAARVSRMNDRDGVATAAENARRLIDPVAAKIDGLSWRDSDIRALMSAITEQSYPDVHSAEQAVLSLHSLATALSRNNNAYLKSGAMKAIDALFEELKPRDDYEPATFAAKLRAVKP